MNAAELKAVVEPIQAIAAVLTQLGVPGLLSVALAGPALIICAMLYFEHSRSVRQEKEREEYREMIE